MPGVAAGDVFSIKSFAFMQGQLGLNVLHYAITAVAGTITDSQLANFFRVFVDASLPPLMSDAAQFQGVGCQLVSPTVFPTVYSPMVPASPGLVAGDPLPKQVCGLITKRTGFVGRAGRGRIYIPFPAESDSTALDAPSAPYLANMALYVGNLITPLTITLGIDTADMIPVIWRTSGPPVPAKAITGTTVRTHWATQRRRSDFGATNTSPFA